MPFANADGAKIHYQVEGGGHGGGNGEDSETLLLIMGLGGHATEWGTQFPAALTERFRVVRMDNRGIGQSTSDSAKWTMQDMANDALAVLDALSVERAHVAGTSMGGMIAQQLAISSPERVSRLALMATTCGGPQAVPPMPEAIALFAPAPELSIAEQRRRALRVITAPGFADKRPDLIEQLVELRLAVPTPGRVFQAQLEAIFTSDRSDTVRGLQMPTFVLHGIDDTLVPVGNGKLLAERIPGARLLLLDDCGHLPHLERSADSAAALLEFFGGS